MLLPYSSLFGISLHSPIFLNIYYACKHPIIPALFSPNLCPIILNIMLAYNAYGLRPIVEHCSKACVTHGQLQHEKTVGLCTQKLIYKLYYSVHMHASPLLFEILEVCDYNISCMRFLLYVYMSCIDGAI